jgi:hypothetical protein
VKIAVVYVFPSLIAPKYEPLARRFAREYVKNPPGGSDHEFWVVVNGPKLNERQERLFEPLLPRFIYHDNLGLDVGAHRLAAEVIPCDLMVFLGSPVWPVRGGWLDLIHEVYLDYGPGLYGTHCFHQPGPHVRTTCYWGWPEIINSHTLPVDDGLRYEWEHGKQSITRHCMKLGYPVMQVTWAGVYDYVNWTHVAERDCLFFDQHYERNGYGNG